MAGLGKPLLESEALPYWEPPREDGLPYPRKALQFLEDICPPEAPGQVEKMQAELAGNQPICSREERQRESAALGTLQTEEGAEFLL